MARTKRQHSFPCGHRGRGKICHRCQQDAIALRQAEEAQAERQRQRDDWVARFSHDPIDLKGLPKPVVEKSRDILTDLRQGKHFKWLDGKRMNFDRTVVRIPVGHHYRMLCRDVNGHLQPWRVMSHEEYNAYARNKRRVS